MRTLIKGGTVVTASDSFAADVLIEDERVVALGENLGDKLEADRKVEARDKLVLPGGIDVHTHIEMPFGGTTSADDWASGTTGAACGGTTCVVDFAIQPPGGGLREGLYSWHQKAEGKAVLDYAFHMIVREVTTRTLIEMDALVKEEGVSSFKLFTAYPGVFMVDDAAIFKAMLKTGENGGLICMHAENGGAIDVLIQRAVEQGNTAPKYHALTRPMRLEDEATNRCIALAEVAEVPVYIVHLSAGDAMLRVREARDRGIPAFAETCPQYLFLSYANYEEPGFDGAKYVMSPPLRPAGNEEALWRGLAGNDLQVVSTDHCPFCMKDQKLLGKDDFSKIPNGAPGIETRMPLLFDAAVAKKRLSLNRMVEISSTAPAKIMGLYPKKGTIAPGSDADIVIFDPKKETTLTIGGLHGKYDYTPYEGRKIQGAVEMVLRRGEVIVVGNKYVGKGGGGRFIKRGPITLK